MGELKPANLRCLPDQTVDPSTGSSYTSLRTVSWPGSCCSVTQRLNFELLAEGRARTENTEFYVLYVTSCINNRKCSI